VRPAAELWQRWPRIKGPLCPLYSTAEAALRVPRQSALFVAIVSCLLTPIMVVNVHGQTDAAVVQVAPRVSKVSTSSPEVDVDINVKNVQNLGGFQFVLVVDPSLLRPVAFFKTAFLAQTNREVICDDPTIEEGAVRVACVTLRDEPPGVDGTGTIGTITLKPLSVGTSDLELSRVKLVHPDGSELASSNVNAELTIAGSGSFQWRTILIVASGIALLLIIGMGAWLRRRLRRRTTI
jgi:hypothetical protein